MQGVEAPTAPTTKTASSVLKQGSGSFISAGEQEKWKQALKQGVGKAGDKSDG